MPPDPSPAGLDTSLARKRQRLIMNAEPVRPVEKFAFGIAIRGVKATAIVRQERPVLAADVLMAIQVIHAPIMANAELGMFAVVELVSIQHVAKVVRPNRISMLFLMLKMMPLKKKSKLKL